MAAGDLVEKGAVVDIGILGYATEVGKIISATVEPIGEINDVLGEQSQTIQQIITNPGTQIALEANILRNSLSTVQAYKVGDAITISAPTANTTWCCQSSRVKVAPAVPAVWSFTGTRRDSLTPA